MSILLPALSGVRRQAASIKCLSNLRQLATAFVAYTNESKGKLPESGMQGQVGGWIHWDAPREVQESPIAPHLGGLNSTEVLVCPSDDVDVRPGAYAVPYKFSYTYNRFFTTDGGWQGIKTISQVRNTSDKIVFVEEDERTINDGRWEPHVGNYGATYPVGERGVDLLAIRHDRQRKDPDIPNLGPWSWVPNPERFGNAAFADGHAAQVLRNQAHDRAYFDPRI